MVNLTPLLNVLTIPAAIAAFLVVFMVSHVINVLILISPFTTVDAALKTARTAVLGTVAGTAFVNPYVGAAWSLVIILVCCLLAGWAFRLMVFGSVFTWDLVTFRKSRFNVEPDSNWMFTARESNKTPIRTYGKLSRGPQGELVLNYRPWLLLPRRTLTLPPGKYAVGRGLFYSEIIELDGDSSPPVMTLPPRFRSHEEELSSIYLLAGVHDIGVVKGFKAFLELVEGIVWIRARGSACVVRAFGVCGLALILAGCASTPVGSSGVKQISVTGSYTHAPSRFVFPESFGKFRRVEINQYPFQRE